MIAGDAKQHLGMQQRAFAYFQHESDSVTGLVADKNAPNWPASIAATGLALTCWPIGVERGFISRDEGVARALRTLRFFADSRQGNGTADTGHHGFYYHFLDMRTGARAWNCEISSIDTAFLVAGMLAAAAYFDRDTPDEAELRKLADALYRRVEWPWLLKADGRIGHGWTPEHGFIPFCWEGYDESLMLHVLALGSPTHPVPPSTYAAWTDSFAWKTCYGIDYLYSAQLFTHQLSHVWLDLRGIRDTFMHAHDSDYFENSRRATTIHRRYAIDNPLGFKGYGECGWGITASDGPGPATRMIDGIERHFYDYVARGAPYGVDDGTLAPWAVAASLPFAPELVEPAIHHYIHAMNLHDCHRYGFRATFNPTFDGVPGSPCGWESPWHFGLNLGPIVAMADNHYRGGTWLRMRAVPAVATGLRRAGFSGGWLDRR